MFERLASLSRGVVRVETKSRESSLERHLYVMDVLERQRARVLRQIDRKITPQLMEQLSELQDFRVMEMVGGLPQERGLIIGDKIRVPLPTKRG